MVAQGKKQLIFGEFVRKIYLKQGDHDDAQEITAVWFFPRWLIYPERSDFPHIITIDLYFWGNPGITCMYPF